MNHIVIVGATSAIAQECAKLWVKESPKHITLVVRDTSMANRILNDLHVRSPLSKIEIVHTDFLNPIEIDKIICAITNQKPVDIALIAHGTLPEQVNCQSDLAICKDTLEINGISPVLFAEGFAKMMDKAGYGTIVIIGSVAGDRGRKTNYTYGAAKGLVSRYAQGLQHRFAGSDVNVILIKPGPTDTPMTASFKEKGGKLAPVQLVGKDIVNGIEAKKAVIYTPRKWQLIMLIIQHIPDIIFNKLKI